MYMSVIKMTIGEVINNQIERFLESLNGEIGNFGELIFQVHTDNLIDALFGKNTTAKIDKWGLIDKYLGDYLGRGKVLTFNNYVRRTQGRYAKHDLINQPELLEYIGMEAEKITLDIKLISSLGVNPAEETALIRQMLKDGVQEYLVIAGEVIGENKWVITDLVEKVKMTDNRGRTILSELAVTFQEYYEPLVIE